MSLYRCAVCGSGRVVPETRQEGYNKKKGIMGMALFGLGGAVAGTSGNTVVYYHCADCGHTLNRCMPDFEKNSIDRFLLDPDNEANKFMLRMKKEQYSNIEWEEPIKEKNDSNEISLQDNQPLTYEEHRKEHELIEIAVLNALYKAKKPCTIRDMQADISCINYPNQKLSAAAKRLVEKRIIEKIVEKDKVYFKVIPNSKDEAIKMLS